MSTFELKTHQIGKTYSKPHFFILNKGLNSGKPLINPCPNCFVVQTTTPENKDLLFNLSAILQIGGFYAINLKGSVIPFLTIDDCRKTLKNSLINYQRRHKELGNHLKAIQIIGEKEKQLKNTIKKLAMLKMAYVKACKIM